MKKFKIIKSSLLLFCILFTILTLVSSIINIILNNPIETHIHILDRAVLTIIGSFVLSIMLEIKLKNNILNFLVPYVIFISLAFIYVYLSGFFVELHKNAYRDVFINDTIVYIVVYIGIFFYKKFQNKHKWCTPKKSNYNSTQYCSCLFKGGSTDHWWGLIFGD